MMIGRSLLLALCAGLAGLASGCLLDGTAFQTTGAAGQGAGESQGGGGAGASTGTVTGGTGGSGGSTATLMDPTTTTGSGGAGGAGGSTGTTTTTGGCTSPADCFDNNQCTSDECSGGTCSNPSLPEGVACPDEQPPECMEAACFGGQCMTYNSNGGSPPSDDDPDDCLIPFCIGGSKMYYASNLRCDDRLTDCKTAYCGVDGSCVEMPIMDGLGCVNSMGMISLCLGGICQ